MTTVKIAFDLSLAGAGDFLTLGDPVKGVMGSPTYVLAGEVLTDVTDYVRSVTIRRGRPKETQQFDTGTANVVLDNRARTFDPTAGTAVSVYSPSIKPRKAITVDVAGQAIYTGIVEDWDLNYSVGGDSTTTAKASDGFTILASQLVPAGTATAQGSGARVAAVLDAVDWPPARRSIDTGSETLMADVVGDNVNARAYLGTIAASEAGAVFIGASGLLEFKGRTALQAVRDDITFGLDGGGIPFTDIGIEYGSENLATSVTVTRSTAGTAVATDTAAVVDYGIIDLDIATVLADDAQAQALADFYSSRYSTPTLRIRSLRVILNDLDPNEAAKVLSLDLADAVQVTFTPNDIGDPIVRTVAIDGIEHDIGPVIHTVSFDFSDTLEGFVIGSPTFGIIGTSRIGF